MFRRSPVVKQTTPRLKRPSFAPMNPSAPPMEQAWPGADEDAPHFTPYRPQPTASAQAEPVNQPKRGANAWQFVEEVGIKVGASAAIIGCVLLVRNEYVRQEISEVFGATEQSNGRAVHEGEDDLLNIGVDLLAGGLTIGGAALTSRLRRSESAQSPAPTLPGPTALPTLPSVPLDKQW